MLSFWSHAGSWMLRISLLVALFKLGGTLLWAAAAGYGVTLDFWFGIIPHFDFEISQDRFVRLVTLSTWLGIIGAGAGLLWVYVTGYRINSRHVAHRQRLVDVGTEARGETEACGVSETDGAASDAFELRRIGPSLEELLAFDRFTERVSQTGLWTGAWIGSLTLLATIGFEMFRHYYFEAYVWQTQHVIATVVAAIPVLALLTMVLLGRFRAALPIIEIEALLVASGFDVVDPDELTDVDDTDHDDADTEHADDAGTDETDTDHDDADTDAVTPIATALGS